MQLMRFREAFEGCDTVFASSREQKPREIGHNRYYRFTEANRDTPLRILRTTMEIVRLVRNERPDVVVTTGAAPGALAILIGRAFGSRTIWVDSIANVERLSLSGRIVKRFADHVLTQWPHLVAGRRPEYRGAII